MSQSENVAQHKAATSSRQYESAVTELRSLEVQIGALTRSMEQDVANSFRARGLRTAEQLQALKMERQTAEKKVASIEQGSPSPAKASLLSAWGLAEGGWPALDLLIETLIGAAIELASFLFLCERRAHGGPNPQPEWTPPPPVPPQRRNRKRTDSDDGIVAPSLKPVSSETAAVCAVSGPSSEAMAVPASYARRLRYEFGARAEAILSKLVGNPRLAASRDLLQRMGEHCLRVSMTDGIIAAATIRTELREGRDWRTVQAYLSLLVHAGLLTSDGCTFTIVHFLDANPTVTRRLQRLEQMRSKTCKRQRKHRAHVQNLQADALQNVELSGLSAARHAQKPPTHTASAANAATHQPTPVQERPSDTACPETGPASSKRAYGAVPARSPQKEQEYQDWREQLARISAGGLQARRMLSVEEANAAADEFEQSLLDDHPSAATQKSAPRGRLPSRSLPCIPVEIPNDPTPVNLHSVATACERIGLQSMGAQVEELFARLSKDAVTQAELRYAAFCTAVRRAKGKIKNPDSRVAHLVSIIHRQRATHAAV